MPVEAPASPPASAEQLHFSAQLAALVADSSLFPSMQECHCMLFLTSDNDFAGKDQTITMDELKAGIQGMQ